MSSNLGAAVTLRAYPHRSPSIPLSVNDPLGTVLNIYLLTYLLKLKYFTVILTYGLGKGPSAISFALSSLPYTYPAVLPLPFATLCSPFLSLLSPCHSGLHSNDI